MPDPNESSDLQQAMHDRLGRLRAMPVDASRLEQALQSHLPQRPGDLRGRLPFLRLNPLRAMAASVLILGVLTAVLVSSFTGPVLASPAQMAQLHNDLVSGRAPVMQVDSIESANRTLAGQSPQSPAIPSLPEDHAMACCMQSVKNKKVACVLLKKEGVPITMTVANAADMRLPKSPTITRNGVTYHVQSHGPLNMLMTERNGRWVCLIGESQPDRLMDIADQLQF